MDKIRKCLLVLLVIFNQLAFINVKALDEVMLEVNKSEIVVEESTKVEVSVSNLEIVSYNWQSDSDCIELECFDNYVMVKGLKVGSAKISVEVEYLKDGTIYKLEDSTNIKVVASKIEATKEIDGSDNEECLDFKTESYLKEHVDSKYGVFDKATLCNILLVKNTLVDVSKLNDNESIDSLMKRNDLGEVFITTIPATVALYSINRDSNYYVALANTMINDKQVEVRDYCFARNNTLGEVVDGCIYDEKAGLVYIPKELFLENGKEVVENIQVQFLQGTKQDTKKIDSKVSVATDCHDDKKVGSGKVNGFLFETSVKTEKGLERNEMIVSVNGVPTNNYEYNKAEGMVTIPASSTAIDNITVDIEEKSVVSKVLDKFLKITDVSAATSFEQMDIAGTISLPDGVSTGWVGDVTLYQGYRSDGTKTLPVYGFGSSEAELINFIYNGGNLDYSKLSSENTNMFLGVYLQGGIDTFTGVNHNSFWNWSIDNVTNPAKIDAWLYMMCTHVSNPLGNGSEWTDNPTRVRVLDIRGDEIVVGFLTQKMNSQSGSGIAKFKIRNLNGDLEIQKTSGNSINSGNNNYSLANAKYELRDGNKVIASLVTDASGKASAKGIKAGNYTLVEVAAPKGYSLNTTSLPITIKAGEKTTISGKGCLVDNPLTSLAFDILKKDSESSNLVQGEASLVNAEFVVKYYNGIYGNLSELPTVANKTWILKTIEDNGRYLASLSDERCLIKDRSDSLFYVNNQVVLPLGTVTIQEVKAPNGYLMDNNIILGQVKQNGNSVVNTLGNEVVVNDKVIKGRIKVSKYSSKTGNNVKYKETMFGIYASKDMYIGSTLYKQGQLIQSLKTVNGSVVSKDLPYGKYVIKETNAPDGYVLNVDKQEVMITSDKNYDVSFSNKEKTGSLKLIKEFSETEIGKLGDAFISGNEYVLYAYEDIYNPALGSVIYQKDEMITKKEVGNGIYGDDGKKYTDINGEISWSNLPLGKYYALEKSSNDSLLLNSNKVIFNKLTEKNLDQEEVINVNGYTDNKVKQQRVEIFKEGIGHNNHNSGKVEGLNGAEFTIKLESEVNKLGWDLATTYDVVTTKSNSNDEKGYALTKYLPYGIYIMKETKTPKGYQTSPDIRFSISKDELVSDNDHLHIVVNDDYYNAYVKIVKKDKDSNKVISLNGASFKIKNVETNEYVSQKIGQTKYNIFTTNSKNQIIVKGTYLNKDDVLGTVVTPLVLSSGVYVLEEVSTPKGFLSLKEAIRFEIGDMIDMVDNDGDHIIEVEVENRQPKGIIKVNKSILDLDTDIDLVDRDDLSKIRFVLKANEDIVDPIDGSTLIEKGEVVNLGKVTKGKRLEDNSYCLSKEGLLEITDLPMGEGKASYVLEEVETLKGAIVDDTKHIIDFIQKDNETVIYEKELTLVNKTTNYGFNKTDVTGDKEVIGAKLTISDENGTVDEWISTTDAHTIEGLIVGKTYTLTETVTAKEYVKASDITFTVKNTSELEMITMMDKQVMISKVDVGGKEVIGAYMQIVDLDGNIVDQWISDGNKHMANNLEEGKTYVLHEDLAPVGMNIANDIKFEVSNKKENQLIKMIDTITEVSKVDEDSFMLQGVELAVVSTKTKNIVDRWVSGRHVFEITDDMKKELIENNHVNGMYIDEDDSTITYLITKNSKRNDYTLMIVKDGITTYSNININGNETSHMIEGLISGEEYILREVKAPKGYASAKEQVFIAGKDESLIMVDESIKVEISKQDISTKEELAGALLKVVDSDGKIVDEWVSRKTSHLIKNLEVGKEYKLIEITAPKGYNLSEEIKFTIKDTTDIQKVVMYDSKLPEIVKTGDKQSFIALSILMLSALMIYVIKRIRI